MSNKQKSIENATIKDKNIKMMVSDPKLKGKITSNITEPDGTVYWYIRFNTPLDPDSVTKHSMNVTELSGYIINVIITYDAMCNMIVLNPMALYRQGEYYLLNISTKVRSDKGKPLAKSVHIMFKLMDDQISEFKVIKDTSTIPKPRKKPESVRVAEIMELMEARAQAGEAPRKSAIRPTLPYGPIILKLQLALLGMIWLAFSLFFNDFYITLIGLSLVVLGLVHICLQLARRRTRAAINYTRGVSRFNKGKYGAAHRFFDKAAKQDPYNDLVKYAVAKVKLYRETS